MAENKPVLRKLDGGVGDRFAAGILKSAIRSTPLDEGLLSRGKELAERIEREPDAEAKKKLTGVLRVAEQTGNRDLYETAVNACNEYLSSKPEAKARILEDMDVLIGVLGVIANDKAENR